MAATRRNRTEERRRNRSKQWRIDLGLAISALTLIPGVPRSAEAIAAYCDCSKQAIEQTEAKGILKLRKAFKARYGIVSSSFFDLVLRA